MAGQMVHLEIPAGNTAKAKEFWGGLFGYRFQSMDGPVEYHMFQTGENEGGAVMQGEGQTGLITYFGVDDIDAARSKIQELGGSAEEKQPVDSVRLRELSEAVAGASLERFFARSVPSALRARSGASSSAPASQPSPPTAR